MKSFAYPFRASALLAALLCIAFSTASCSSKEKVEARPEYKNPILVHIKVPAPIVLGQKINMLATELDPTGQAAMMLPMFLQSYGYPKFDGISATDPVTLFVLGEPEDDEPAAVLFIKASRETPLITQLMQQANAQLKPHGEWLMLADSAEDLGRVVDADELAEFAAAQPTYDIQLTVLTDNLIGLRDTTLADMKAEMEGNEEISEEIRAMMLGFANLGFDELETTLSMIGGIDITPEAISFATDAEALDGTPLGNFLSQNTPGRITGGDAIPTGYSMGGVIDYNPDATVAYWDYIMDKIVGFIPEAYREDLSTLQGLMRDYVNASGPISGFAFDMQGLSTRTVQVVEGDFTEDTIHALYDFTAETVLPRVMEMLQSTGDPELQGFNFTARYQRDVGEIQGLAYHTYVQEMDLPESASGDVPPEMAGLQKQEYFIALHEGDLLLATSLDLLDNLAEAVINDTELPDAMSRMFQPEPGAVAQAYFDVIRYYGNVLTSLPPEAMGEGQAAKMLPILKMLMDAGIPPIRYKLFAADNRGSLEFEIPMSTLKQAVETIVQGMSGAGQQNPGSTPGM